MEIVITSDNKQTTIKIVSKDTEKLIDAIYWFLRDNKINPTVEVKEI